MASKPSKTRLFNIRITHDKHARFKKYAEQQGLSMGGILLGYIDTLIDGTGQVHGFEDKTRTTAKWDDPLDAIRDQYEKGKDF